MPFPLVPVAIGALATAAFAAKSRRNRPVDEVTQAHRMMVYKTLVSDVKDPEVLRRFARVFHEEGLTVEAELLEARALLREQPPELKKARNEAYKKGMASKNPEGIRALAREFDNIGATGAAQSLRDTAAAVERALAEGTVKVEEANPGIDAPADA
jgi:hypothetical protein